MATASPTNKASAPPSQPISLGAGFLSYLVPGLGQIYQGRIGKGLLFLVCVYGLFFYGTWLGSGEVEEHGQVHRITSNVFLPHSAAQNNPWRLPSLAADLYNRPQFLGQFWAGVVVWPAVWQYRNFNENAKAGPIFGTFMRDPGEATINSVQKAHDKTYDLGWVFTVIAGVLNVMIIYDAFAGAAFAGAGGTDRSRETQAKNASASDARP